MALTPTIIATEDKTKSAIHRGKIYSSASSRTSNLKIRLLRSSLILFIVSLASTCSLAQDINTNTVIQGPPISPSSNKTKKAQSNGLKAAAPVLEFDCPSHELAGFALIFSIPCKTNAECKFLGVDQRCCKRYCRKGVPAPPKEPHHRAVLGVNRMCPKEPVPEVLPVKSCTTDIDCEEERRVCCPDKDLKLYCRTAAPVWSNLPFPRAHAPLMSLIGYMQCQSAPPQLLDLFPQPCNRTMECLPNLCCQEGPSKFCRPPKKSVLALVAQATQRFARG